MWWPSGPLSPLPPYPCPASPREHSHLTQRAGFTRKNAGTWPVLVDSRRSRGAGSISYSAVWDGARVPAFASHTRHRHPPRRTLRRAAPPPIPGRPLFPQTRGNRRPCQRMHEASPPRNVPGICRQLCRTASGASFRVLPWTVLRVVPLPTPAARVLGPGPRRLALALALCSARAYMRGSP